MWNPFPLSFVFPSIICKGNVTLLQRHLLGTNLARSQQAMEKASLSMLALRNHLYIKILALLLPHGSLESIWGDAFCALFHRCDSAVV